MRYILTFFIVMTWGTTQGFSSDLIHGQLVEVEAREVFIPNGFDDNDEVSMVVDGWLLDGCYRLTRPEVEVDHAAGTIMVKPMARWFDVPCIKALVPYNFEIHLGILSMGDYEVETLGGLTETLQVAEATNAGPDDFLYAPVDSVTVDKAVGTEELIATLKGRFTNSCMTWSEVRVFDSGSTVEVLPIIEMEDRMDCTDGLFPFERAVELPDTLTTGRHLLHVRSLSGRHVNHMFSKNAI